MARAVTANNESAKVVVMTDIIEAIESLKSCVGGDYCPRIGKASNVAMTRYGC